MANNIVIRYSALPKLLTKDRQTFLSSLDVRLSTVNLAPDPAGSNGQFTEPTDSGYAPLNLTYGAPFLNGSNQGETDAAVDQWTFTHSAGDFTVYAQFATDPADSDEWVWAALSTLPFTCVAAGQMLQAVDSWLNTRLP